MGTKGQIVAKAKITKKDKDGIKAIIFLQEFAGIKESKDKALRGWRGMNAHEQEHTLKTYQMLKS